MAQELYNEGRVVGFSAWEIFARDAIAHGLSPEDIPDEHEWLTDMLCNGSSMILRVDANTPKGYVDYPLPANTKLTAAGVIIGSLFIGTCDIACDEPGGDPNCHFATRVTSYGPLIKNVSGSGNHPGASPDNVPVATSDGYPDYSNYLDEIIEFVKINDGIVYSKTAQWIPTGDSAPYDDINPDYPSSQSVVRLYISEPINSDIYILLTGFEHKAFLEIISGWATSSGGVAAGGSTDISANNWQSGGMIGPETIPWASKIIFTVPSSAYSLSTNITRTMPKGASSIGTGDPITIDNKVNIRNYIEYKPNASPFIDFDSITLTDYYTRVKHFSTDPTITETVNAINRGFASSYNSLIAWYPGMSVSQVQIAINNDDASNFFPPALYAAKVSASGDQILIPMDTAAPGTVKCFDTKTEAINYRTLLPNNYAIYHNTENHTYSFVDGSDENNWFSSVKLDYLTAPIAKLTTNTKIAKFVALTDSTGSDYNLNGSAGTIGSAAPLRLRWVDLLDAIVENKTVDVLGTRLYNFGQELSSINTIGIDPQYAPITKIGTPQFVINPQSENSVSITQTTSYGSSLATVEKGKSIKTGTNYIEFTRTKSGGQTENLRLYISTESPGSENIPVGSIGIGW